TCWRPVGWSPGAGRTRWQASTTRTSACAALPGHRRWWAVSRSPDATDPGVEAVLDLAQPPDQALEHPDRDLRMPQQERLQVIGGDAGRRVRPPPPHPRPRA